jgi:subtilisin family serine protease
MIKSICHQFILLFFWGYIFTSSSLSAADYKEYLIRVSDSLITDARQSTRMDQISSLKRSLGFSDDIKIEPITEYYNTTLDGWYKVSVPLTKTNQIELAETNRNIEHLQQNNTFKVHDNTPNDPLYTDQWYHPQIMASESWDYFIPNEEIILAIIDTGIDYQHPDLQGSLWINSEEDLNGNGRLDKEDLNNIDDDNNGYVDDVIGWDFTDAPRYADGGDFRDPDNDPMDDYFGGHGTRIAGIIAARTGNSEGIAGLTPGLKVMNLRAGTAGGFLEEDDVARAVLYAINNGARVINMSFGDVVVSRFLKDVIYFAYSEGIVIVASAGNSGTDITHYPSGLEKTISVGASDRSDNRAGFSNWGYSIDLVAPGVDILSPKANGGYDTVNGTSFSAPMVTAAVGLIMSNNPEYSIEEIRNILKTSADDIGIKDWDDQTGSGRLNLYQASQVVQRTQLLVNYPSSESGINSDTLPIIVTATHPDLATLDVLYGIGESPGEWFDLVNGHPYQVLEDTIAIMSISDIPDTSLIINLRINTWSGDQLEYYSRALIDRSPPVILDLLSRNILDEDNVVSLIEFKTDDITAADIFYRPVDSEDSFDVIHLSYETDHHFHLFAQSGEMDYYLRVINSGGLSTIENNSGRYYYLNNTSGNVYREEFEQVNQVLPAGFMLDQAVDIDNDGNFEAILSAYDEFGAFGSVVIYEFDGNSFEKQYETAFKGIPRSFGDSDGDGKSEILIGYGQQSFLLEAEQPNDWPKNIIWADSGDIWVSTITDLDKDGNNEIIGKRDKTFILLESTGDNQFQEKYIFYNVSDGENQLGPPRCEIADLDDDGNLELIFGDYDGDLIIYENSGNDMFDAARSIQLPLRDATNYFVSGNVKTPEKTILIAGTHNGTSQLLEHQAEGLYWDFSVLSVDAEEQYKFDQHLHVHGYANVRDFEAGINTGLMKYGESDYLFLAPFPDLYLYKIESDRLVPVWYKSAVNTNTILIHDFDQNGVSEFYVNNGDQIVGFEKDTDLKPLPPTGIDVYPLDTNFVKLEWNPSEAADRYIIYKGDTPESLSRFDSTITENSYIDSSVIENQHYYYALQTVDFSYDSDRSKLSPTYSAIPNIPPAIDTLIIKNDSQIELYFSESMDISTILPKNFVIHTADNPTTSAISFLHGRAVLLSFSNPFIDEYNYQMELIALRDTNRTPLPVNESVISFAYALQNSIKPYVREWKVDSGHLLTLTFNVPMNSNTLLNTSNYVLEPSGSVEKIEVADELQQKFVLHLSSDTYGSSSGITTYLSLNNLQTVDGIILEEGNRIALVNVTNSISDLMVYPQPATIDNDWLMFSNIAEGTIIRIFDINGHFIAQFEENDQNGGVRWDLRDQSGNKVSSGIYIYYATFDNQTKLGKFTIVK